MSSRVGAPSEPHIVRQLQTIKVIIVTFTVKLTPGIIVFNSLASCSLISDSEGEFDGGTLYVTFSGVGTRFSLYTSSM